MGGLALEGIGGKAGRARGTEQPHRHEHGLAGGPGGLRKTKGGADGELHEAHDGGLGGPGGDYFMLFEGIIIPSGSRSRPSVEKITPYAAMWRRLGPDLQ